MYLLLVQLPHLHEKKFDCFCLEVDFPQAAFIWRQLHIPDDIVHRRDHRGSISRSRYIHGPVIMKPHEKLAVFRQ